MSIPLDSPYLHIYLFTKHGITHAIILSKDIDTIPSLRYSGYMADSNPQIQQKLLSLGFPEKEAKVYLALLSLGKGTVSQIAREAGILRTTTYDILDSLVSKDLVNVSGKEPKQEYVAEEPGKLALLIQREIKKQEQALHEAEGLIPQLTSIHNVSARPKVMFYEGKEGMEHVYEDTLTSHEPIRAYANVKEMHDALPAYFPKYYQRRTEKGISIRAIVPANEAGKNRAIKDAQEARESALVPADKYYFSPEINIYDNKVMIASWKEKLGIIIESHEIADAMKTIYELAWNEAKRLENTLPIANTPIATRGDTGLAKKED